MARERRAGREIEHPHLVFIPILEYDVSRLSGTVPVLWPPGADIILLCPLMHEAESWGVGCRTLRVLDVLLSFAFSSSV